MLDSNEYRAILLFNFIQNKQGGSRNTSLACFRDQILLQSF